MFAEKLENLKSFRVGSVLPYSFLNVFDPLALIIGFSLFGGIYMCIPLYASMNAQSTLDLLQGQLSHETVVVGGLMPAPSGVIDDQIFNPEKTDLMIKGLTEKTEYGLLPIIRRSDNLTSFRAYQTPFSFENLPQKPVISFLVTDFGLSVEQSKNAIDMLPAEVSFMLSPYASMANEWIGAAHSEGHEIWLNLPIQNDHMDGLGQNALFHHSSISEKQEKFRRNLSRAYGYVGITSYTDETLDMAKEDYRSIIEEIYQRGLGYVELNPDSGDFIEGKALAISAPFIRTNMTLWAKATGSNSFEELEKRAQENGLAIAIVPAYPKTIKDLAVWIEKVGRIDYAIIPISAIYDLPLHRDIHSSHGKKKNSVHNENHNEGH